MSSLHHYSLLNMSFAFFAESSMASSSSLDRFRFNFMLHKSQRLESTSTSCLQNPGLGKRKKWQNISLSYYHSFSLMIGSPNIHLKFRPQICSAMPAIADDEGLDTITLGDDDVLSDQNDLKEVTCDLTDDTAEDPKSEHKKSKKEAKTRFLMRFWSWIQAKTKLQPLNTVEKSPPQTPRRKSSELHTKKLLTTKVTGEREAEIILNKWRRVHSNETLTRSWADVCIPNAGHVTSTYPSFYQYKNAPLRRCSYMPPAGVPSKPPGSERYRASSLVVPNQSASLLHPLTGSRREFSLESGYLSHEGSSSTPNSPKKFMLGQIKSATGRRGVLSKSTSEEDGSGSPTVANKSKVEYLGEIRQHTTAREKRQLWHR